MNNELVRQNISMYQIDWNIIQEVANKYGLSTSGALRFIIRDWALHNERATVNSVQPNESQPTPPSNPAD